MSGTRSTRYAPVVESSHGRVAAGIATALTAAAGWVCLFLWWNYGGVALLTACPVLEIVAFVLLMGLLRHRVPA
jgi:hypothetical protein